jgi:polysaccharide biosynthesis protein PslG
MVGVQWRNIISIRSASLCVIAALWGGYTKPVSFSILEDYDKGSALQKIAADLALFRELGITTWRGSFGWDDYEPVRGRYDLDWLDQFATLADTMGISLRPYLGYTPSWAAHSGRDTLAWNDPPQHVEDWVRFVGAVAGRLRNHSSMLSYEIYNEENVPLWWDGTAAEYTRILVDGGRAIRRADPKAQVLLGGMVWPDEEWLESACSKGDDSFDVLPFHAYPETWTPDSITVENYLGSGFEKQFVQEADRRCGRKPIWINEAGFATSPGESERQQANWWARAFATFLAEPRIEHLGIYEIRDQEAGTPVIGDSPNCYLGLVRRDGRRKLAFETVKLLVRLFGNDSITVADPALRVVVLKGKAGGLHQHLFARPDGRFLVFLWDTSANPHRRRRVAPRSGEGDLVRPRWPWQRVDELQGAGHSRNQARESDSPHLRGRLASSSLLSGETARADAMLHTGFHRGFCHSDSRHRQGFGRLPASSLGRGQGGRSEGGSWCFPGRAIG